MFLAGLAALMLVGCSGGTDSSPSASAQPTTSASREVMAAANATATTFFTDYLNQNFVQAAALATGPALLRAQYYVAVTSINGIPEEDLPSKLADVSVESKITEAAQSGSTLTSPGFVELGYVMEGEKSSETKFDLVFEDVGGRWLLSDWRTKYPDGEVIPPTSDFWFPGSSTQTVDGITAQALLGVGFPNPNRSMDFFDWVVSVDNAATSEARLTGFTLTTDTGVTGQVTVAPDGTLTSNFPANLDVHLAATTVYPAGGSGWVYASFPAGTGVRGGKIALTFATASGEVKLAVDLPAVTVPAGYAISSPSASASG